MVRTFWGVDKKRNPGFSFLSQTIVSVSFTKERWTFSLLRENFQTGLGKARVLKVPSEALDNIILLTICDSVRNNVTKISKLVTMQGRSQRGGGATPRGPGTPIFWWIFF